MQGEKLQETELSIMSRIKYRSAEPHDFDADPDPDRAYHFDADPDLDPDPAYQFVADPAQDPDPDILI